MPDSRWQQYLNTLRTNFRKRTTLEFLQPDGSVAFAVDNNPRNPRSSTFIKEGQLSVNLQNGTRRNASIKLVNVDGLYDYNVNNIWFGTQVRLLMGLVLPNGEDYMIPQGVFYIKDPTETLEPTSRTVQLNLVDKWAMLDGTLGGKLEGTYEVGVGSNIFQAIDGVLQIQQGNGHPLDSTPPCYTNYYNDKMQTLPDGSVVPLSESPYTVRIDSNGSTYASVILELNEMIAGWIGYDSTGALRIDPSQDDILDITKPVVWAFTPTEKQFLGASYTIKNSAVKNDIIRVGEALNEGHAQVGGRAQNLDPQSDTNINLIGRKVDRQSAASYYTDDICMALAEFDLKRNTILNKSVSIKSTQMFHLQENTIVTIQRNDKNGTPVERHLVNGFSIPIAGSGNMTINATSVSDFPIATVTSLSDYNLDS